MREKIRDIIEYLLNLLYPRRCPFCNNILDEMPKRNWDSQNFVCNKCRRQVPYIREPVCKKCGKQLENMRAEYCMDCSRKTHFYEQGKALLSYQGDVKLAIYRFKYSNKREYAVFFGKAAAEHYKRWALERKIQVIVPIPLHRKRRKSRGYNQAELFAGELGKEWGIPVDTQLLYRVKNTVPQKELTEAERKNNLQNALKTSVNIVQYDYILIVDDIYTTGSTIDTAAKVLLQAGAKKIFFCCIAIGRGL